LTNRQSSVPWTAKIHSNALVDAASAAQLLHKASADRAICEEDRIGLEARRNGLQRERDQAHFFPNMTREMIDRLLANTHRNRAALNQIYRQLDIQNRTVTRLSDSLDERVADTYPFFRPKTHLDLGMPVCTITLSSAKPWQCAYGTIKCSCGGRFCRHDS
jgi:hypothetical protein